MQASTFESVAVVYHCAPFCQVSSAFVNFWPNHRLSHLRNSKMATATIMNFDFYLQFFVVSVIVFHESVPKIGQTIKQLQLIICWARFIMEIPSTCQKKIGMFWGQMAVSI